MLLGHFLDALVQAIQIKGAVLVRREVLNGGLEVQPLGHEGTVVPPDLGDLPAIEVLTLRPLEDLGVALDLELALVVFLALQDRNGKGRPEVVFGRLGLLDQLLVRLLLPWRGAVFHLDEGLPYEDILVALAPVGLLDVLDVLFEVLLHQEIAASDPGEKAVALGLLHDPRQAAARYDLVAPEGDPVDLGLAALLDVEDQSGHTRGHGLQGNVHNRVPEALLGSQFHDEPLDLAGSLGIIDAVRIDGELLFLDLVLQGADPDLGTAPVVHFFDERALRDPDGQQLATSLVRQLELDVIKGA